MEESTGAACPFGCGFKPKGEAIEYQFTLHMATAHPEDGPSPFAVQDDASMAALINFDDSPSPEDYIDCTVEGCGEVILLKEIASHVEMHQEEKANVHDDLDDDEDDRSSRSSRKRKFEDEIEGNFNTTSPPKALRNLDKGMVEGESSHVEISSKRAAFNRLFNIGSSPKAYKPPTPIKSSRRRLGKSELGPYANEKQMPARLVKLLKEGDGATKTVTRRDGSGKRKEVQICPNMMSGVIPVIEQLLRQDRLVETAYLCDPAVRHVSKLKKEGGFCGYRNLQTLCSYIIEVDSQGFEHFKGKIPSIFEIQDYIENAWDLGINESGRVETGGIRGTRKYIGTPDAQAMLCSLGIACDAQAFKPARGSSKPAYELLFKAVEDYFVNGCVDFESKVRCTSLPPIYFQHPGHSMTIIGIERRIDGARNIIVFDPMFHDSLNVTRFIGQSVKHNKPQDLLKAYRRGSGYLKRYSEFELLKLTPPKAEYSDSHGFGA